MIVHGKNDPRVKKEESDQIVKSLLSKDIPVNYVVFPDEGHGMSKPKNILAQYTLMEIFLHNHLGGKLEPLGNEIKKSSAQILAGKIDS